MNYSVFDVQEFCEDADFIRWVVSPTDELNQFWNTFLIANPSKSKDIQIAREYIKTLHFQEVEVEQEDLTRLRNRIWGDIEKPVVKINWWKNPRYWSAAAAIFVIASVGMYWRNNQPTMYETAFGQIKKISLEDGSVVTLNAHSSLRVAENLGELQVREVWLDGEAYFDIAKLKGAKFIVHTTEAEIEVLGTEFNVNTRRKKTKVILHEGKVKLSVDSIRAVVMKPGDMATVLDRKKSIELKIVQPEQYEYWKQSIIVLNDKSVSEVLEILEDNYGISIQFENPIILNKKLSGKLSIKSSEEFIQNFATILDAEYEKTEKGYFFR